MKKVIVLILFLLFAYTRLVGLDWGLPYPMHPDERNMAVALQQLSCKEFSIFNFQFSNLKSCFNPNFFAYGQPPLYAAYILVKYWHIVSGSLASPISFSQATMALRLLSVFYSFFTFIISLKIIELFIWKISPDGDSVQDKDIKSLRQFSLSKTGLILIPSLLIIFSPYAVQFAHFGTTESLLMLLYSLTIYLSLKITVNYLTIIEVILLGVVTGLSIATKISSVIFIVIPLLAVIFVLTKQLVASGTKRKELLKQIAQAVKFISLFLIMTSLFVLLLSPHNLINMVLFLSSMGYETAVATGGIKVFYTRIFEDSIPFTYQFTKVFPYALGWPQLILFLAGFIFLSWRDYKINLLRLALIIYFIPTAFLFAKWSRFMAPVFPVMTIFAILFLLKFFSYLSAIKKVSYPKLYVVYFILIAVAISPALAYLSIYRNGDGRFVASEWIYQNIPSSSYILSETANVVDIPLFPPNYKLPITNYKVISFDFYNLDTDPNLAVQLEDHLQKADYILVPSRRLFANHTCTKVSSSGPVLGEAKGYLEPSMKKQRCENLKRIYPLLNQYYENLFSGKLGFTKIAEISSYPRLELLGKTLVEFPDENAEETWTVFDHPVVRVYKRL